jgi:hypothetical protein
MSEPHQSRVFTFIGNRANQLKNTCVRGLRHLRVAVVWGGQILLYPFQLLAQTTIFQPQIDTPPSRSGLPQPTSDINIEQALELVEIAGHPIEFAHKTSLVIDDWSFIDENLWDTSHGNAAIKNQEISYSPHNFRQVTPSKPIIRGLSSRLVDRQLVLVTIENQLLDILTISQQQEIYRRIGFDIATNWHQWHINKLSGDNSTHKFASREKFSLTSETEIDREIPFQNLFDRLSNWFQKKSQTFSIQSEKIEFLPPKSLDLLPPGRASFLLTSESLFDRGEILSQNLSNRLGNWFQKVTHSQSRNSFIQPKSFDRLSPDRDRFIPQPPSLEKLFELPQLPPIKGRKPIITDRHNPVREIVAKLQPDWFKKLWSYYRDYLYTLSTDRHEIIHQSAEFDLIPIEPNDDRITSTHPPEHQTQVVQNSAKLSAKFYRDLEHHPDWIETESELIGYNRSLLTRCLSWLDLIMLKIENWLIKIWNQITNHFSLH